MDGIITWSHLWPFWYSAILSHSTNKSMNQTLFWITYVMSPNLIVQICPDLAAFRSD